VFLSEGIPLSGWTLISKKNGFMQFQNTEEIKYCPASDCHVTVPYIHGKYKNITRSVK